MNLPQKTRHPDFALICIKLRKKTGRSLQTLSLEMGFSNSYLGKICNGKNTRLSWSSGDVLIRAAKLVFDEDELRDCGVGKS